MKSLRQRLLAWLLPPVIVVGVVAAGGAYVFMERRLTAAYDLDLGDIARALVPYLRSSDGAISLDFNPQAEAVLRADSTDQIFYAVIDSRGRVATGDTALPTPPSNSGATPRFWDGLRQGRAIRAVALRTMVEGAPVIVIAAETTIKRESAERDAMVSAIAPVTLLSIAAIAAVIFGVRRGLGPVEKLREEVQARSHVDLRPIDEDNAVDELRPLVHELNEMFSRLQAAQHTQARFIANAAHQLRTPIAGLVTQLDLVGSDSAGQQTHLAHAREGAARLARLARQVLSLAAADPIANPGESDASCDLAEIVKSHAGEWLRAATPRKVEMEFDLSPASVRGNALLIGELASNLVDNAARYGAKTVRIATRLCGDRAILEVADDGPGIAPAERAHIFERFRRLDNESTEGSGLGLAIVSEIAERHRAAVEVTEGPDLIGTRVAVSFPVA
jgi:two-component system sensor histidine kinase TctE